MSLGEIMMKPTAMLYRNLLSMETEVVALCGLLSRVPQGILLRCAADRAGAD